MNWEFLIFIQALVPSIAEHTNAAAKKRPASMP